jgi:hypothetical protein
MLLDKALGKVRNRENVVIKPKDSNACTSLPTNIEIFPNLSKIPDKKKYLTLYTFISYLINDWGTRKYFVCRCHLLNISKLPVDMAPISGGRIRYRGSCAKKVIASIFKNINSDSHVLSLICVVSRAL